MAVEDPAKDPTTAPPAEGAAATDAPSNLNSAYAADVAIREDDDAGDEDMDDDDDEGSEGPIEAGAPFDAVRAQKKRKERLEQNRISARESRKRKKTMIEELQRTVITLSKENKDLNDRNEQLRSQLMDIGRKVRQYFESKHCHFVAKYSTWYGVMIPHFAVDVFHSIP